MILEITIIDIHQVPMYILNTVKETKLSELPNPDPSLPCTDSSSEWWRPEIEVPEGTVSGGAQFRKEILVDIDKWKETDNKEIKGMPIEWVKIINEGIIEYNLN